MLFRRLSPLAGLLLVPLVGCDSNSKGTAAAPAKVPVTVIKLEVTEPARRNMRMGLVEPYRQADVGFEVSGRVNSVLDVGVEVVGLARGLDGKIVRKGDVLARLDSDRYERKVDSLKAKIAAQEAELQAQIIDTEKVAAAQAELAKTQYDRYLKLIKSGTTTQENVERAKANYQVKLSTLQLKEAKVLSARAAVKELQEDLKSAKLDLADCVLRAPFPGRITRQHVSRGAFVQAGSPVVTVTLLDPVKIIVAVSAEDDRRIVLGSQARIYPDKAGLGEGGVLEQWGRVKSKGQVADAKTRTFPIEVMTRNQRYTVPKSNASIDFVAPILQQFQGEKGPLMAIVDTVLREGDKTYLLVVPKADVLSGKQRLMPTKVEVTLGDHYWTVLDWTMREVKGEGLKLEDFAIRNPKPEHLKGFEVEQQAWFLRPGDMVPVGFPLGALSKGIYVPVPAVKELNGKTYVFLVADGKAKQVEVSVHESLGELRRIEGEGIEPGADLVVRGAHYVADGALLSVQDDK